MGYQHIQIPTDGEAIIVNSDLSLTVPDRPIISFVEGDGIGVDITPVMKKVTDAAVAKAYGGNKSIAWMEAEDNLSAAIRAEAIRTQIENERDAALARADQAEEQCYRSDINMQQMQIEKDEFR